jgi:hypothetical protein
MSYRHTTPAVTTPGLSTRADPVEQTEIPTEAEIAAICRTAVGDSLRSVIHFTREDSDLLYLRKDLYGDDRRRALEVKAGLIERERVGFTPYEQYEPHSAGAGSDPVLGDYEFTVRVFTDGYVCRVIAGDHGLLLTAEELDVDRIEEVAIALRGLLSEAYGAVG